VTRAAALLPLVLLAAACGGGAAAPAQVDVSHLSGPQNEVTAAVDPSNPDVVLAGSNSLQQGYTHAYTSTDGGKTWQDAIAPVLASGARFEVDPAVAIDSTGREYYAALEGQPTPLHVFVSTRAGPHARWSTPVDLDPKLGSLAPFAIDDKDAIDVDRTHVYVVWSRFLTTRKPRHSLNSIMLSRSTDGGRTWSLPVTVTSTTEARAPGYGSVAAAGETVWVSWQNDFSGTDRQVLVARSTDGGAHFGAPVDVGVHACRPNGWKLRGAPEAGAPPAPIMVRTADGVAIAYGTFDCSSRPEVHVVQLDPTLRQRRDRQLGEGFFGTPAYDADTHDLWVCWYAVRADLVHTRYTCTVNDAKPRAAASVDSDETGPLAAHGFSGREYGDYATLAVSRGVAHPFWTDSRDLKTLGEEIYTTTLKAWK
jgi:hypothetical protein